MVGYLNLDMYENEKEGSKPNKILVDFCQRFSFVNLITEPTRVTEKSKTLLDVILSSHVERFATSGNLSLGISDHDLIYTIRKCKLPRPKPRTIEYRSFKHFREEDFIAALQKKSFV